MGGTNHSGMSPFLFQFLDVLSYLFESQTQVQFNFTNTSPIFAACWTHFWARDAEGSQGKVLINTKVSKVRMSNHC